MADIKQAWEELQEVGYCYGVEDGLDGYCIHDKKCRNAGRTWTGPNTDCIKEETSAEQT